jgi:molecular chaperone GrpE (heat shock protein)
MNNEPYGWVKNGEYVLYIEKPDSVFNYIPLYTHQYERPHNTVLVPCDKLAEMQAEIKKWTDQYQRLNENLEMWKAGHFKQQAEIEALKNIIANLTRINC